MKIVLIGYGKMGKLLEIKAEERGHSIFKVLNKPNWLKEDLLGSDVAIDFSNPNSALENIYKSFQIGIPIVVGTTGWYEEIEKLNLGAMNIMDPFYQQQIFPWESIFFLK